MTKFQKTLKKLKELADKENCPFFEPLMEEDAIDIYICHVPLPDEVADEWMYDGYELHHIAVNRDGDEGDYEDFEPEDIVRDYWAVFGHCVEGGVADIGDFDIFENAWNTFRHLSMTYLLATLNISN